MRKGVSTSQALKAFSWLLEVASILPSDKKKISETQIHISRTSMSRKDFLKTYVVIIAVLITVSMTLSIFYVDLLGFPDGR